MAACNFNITRDIDIISIIEEKKRRNYKFNPMFIHKICRALNTIIEARIFKIDDDYLLPIVSFGPYYCQDGSYKKPVSIRANHKTLDGYHIHLFFQELGKIWI